MEGGESYFEILGNRNGQEDIHVKENDLSPCYLSSFS